MDGYLLEQVSKSSRLDPTTPLRVTAPPSQASDSFENHLRAPDSNRPSEDPLPPARSSSSSNSTSSQSGSNLSTSNSPPRASESDHKPGKEPPASDRPSDSKPASAPPSSQAPKKSSSGPSDEGRESPPDAASDQDSKLEDDDAAKTVVVAAAVHHGHVDQVQINSPAGKAGKAKSNSDAEAGEDKNEKGSPAGQKTKLAKASAQGDPTGIERSGVPAQDEAAQADDRAEAAGDGVKQAGDLEGGEAEANANTRDKQAEKRSQLVQHSKVGPADNSAAKAAANDEDAGQAGSEQAARDAQTKPNAADSQTTGKGRTREAAATRSRHKEPVRDEPNSNQHNGLETPPGIQAPDSPQLSAIIDSTSSDDAHPAPPQTHEAQGDKAAAVSASSGSEAAAGNGSGGAVGRLSQHLIARGKSAEAGPELREADHSRFLHRVARAFEAAQDRGGGEIRLRLSPPELGSLKLHVKIEGGALSAHIEADTQHARAMLIDNLPQLRERLAEQNIRVEHFDVDVPDRQSGGAPDHSGEGWRESSDAAHRLPPGGGETPGDDEAAASLGAAHYQRGSSQLNVII